MDRIVKEIYTPEEIKGTYEQVHDLLITRYIIKAYSTNRNDIRSEAIHGMNLATIRRVVELGCGYGFFIEKLKGLLDVNAHILGIDMVGKNREPFLQSVASIGYEGEFITGNADAIASMDTSSFDCVIASYSLYFFPHLIPEIARVLNDDGVFLSITHSRNTLGEAIKIINECMEEHGILEKGGSAIEKLFSAFPMEDGLDILRPYFGRIERVDYINSMVFPRDRVDDLYFYLRQKKSLIYRNNNMMDPAMYERITRSVEERVAAYAQHSGHFSLNKNDAVFRCYQPLK